MRTKARDDHEQLKAAFIAQRGVTRCPTVQPGDDSPTAPVRRRTMFRSAKRPPAQP